MEVASGASLRSRRTCGQSSWKSQQPRQDAGVIYVSFTDESFMCMACLVDVKHV